jgi:ribosomal protein S4
LYQRLTAVNNRREALEKLILASMKTVELNTRSLSNETNAILEGRLQDIEMIPQLAAEKEKAVGPAKGGA